PLQSVAELTGGAMPASPMSPYQPAWNAAGNPAGGPAVLGYQSTYDLPYELAGFWLRFVAYIIDYILTYIAGLIIGLVIGVIAGAASGGGRGGAEVAQVFGGLLGLVITWLYYALMESSSKQATIGKMALGLQVTDMEGKPVTFGRATGRYWGK